MPDFRTREFQGPPRLCYAEGPDNGPPLVLLHGVTRCWQEWEGLLRELAGHWRILAVDHRGHGGSERASRYLVTDYGADAARFLRETISEPAVIVGHSLGAMVAASVAAEVPDLVRAAALEDPPFHTMGNHIAGSAWQAQFAGMREAGRRGGTIGALAEALAEIRLPSGGGAFRRLGDIRDRAALLWSAECLSRLDAEVLTPVIEGRWLDGYDRADIFTRIRCPVLLLQGDPAAGGALSDEDVQMALRNGPSRAVVRFPGASHQIHRERPAEMLRALEDFCGGAP